MSSGYNREKQKLQICISKSAQNVGPSGKLAESTVHYKLKNLDWFKIQYFFERSRFTYIGNDKQLDLRYLSKLLVRGQVHRAQ